jgi:hypothetical protein
MRNSEPTELFNVQEKRCARNTLMDKFSSACQSPTSSEPIDQFARDDAIQKLTQEFIGLGNLEKKMK